MSANNSRSRSGIITNVIIQELNANKEVISTLQVSNRVTKTMLVGLVRWLAGEFNPTNQLEEPDYIPRYIGLGVGTSKVRVSDNHLDSEVSPYNEIYPPLDDEGNPTPIPNTTRFPIETRVINTYTTGSTCAVRYKAYIPKDAYRGVTIKEIGLFSHESGNNALARVVLKDNQYLIRRTTADYFLSIEWIVVVESVEASTLESTEETQILGSIWRPIGSIVDDVSLDYWDEELSEGGSGGTTPIIPSSTIEPVYNFKASSDDYGITLSWENPTFDTYAGVIIVRKANTPPSYLDDGVRIYNGVGTSTSDTTAKDDVLYYYRAFSYNTSLKYNSFDKVISSAKITTKIPNSVSDLIVLPNRFTIKFSYKLRSAADIPIQEVIICRSTTGFSDRVIGDDIIYSGTDETFEDTNAEDLTKYYYSIFTRYARWYSEPIHIESALDLNIYSFKVNITEDDLSFGLVAEYGSSSIKVNWGDGSPNDNLYDVPIEHTYSLPGIYTIQVVSEDLFSDGGAHPSTENYQKKVISIETINRSQLQYDFSNMSIKSITTPINFANDPNRNSSYWGRLMRFSKMPRDAYDISKSSSVNNHYVYKFRESVPLIQSDICIYDEDRKVSPAPVAGVCITDIPSGNCIIWFATKYSSGWYGGGSRYLLLADNNSEILTYPDAWDHYISTDDAEGLLCGKYSSSNNAIFNPIYDNFTKSSTSNITSSENSDGAYLSDNRFIISLIPPNNNPDGSVELPDNCGTYASFKGSSIVSIGQSNSVIFQSDNLRMSLDYREMFSECLSLIEVKGRLADRFDPYRGNRYLEEFTSHNSIITKDLVGEAYDSVNNSYYNKYWISVQHNNLITTYYTTSTVKSYYGIYFKLSPTNNKLFGYKLNISGDYHLPTDDNTPYIKCIYNIYTDEYELVNMSQIEASAEIENLLSNTIYYGVISGIQDYSTANCNVLLGTNIKVTSKDVPQYIDFTKIFYGDTSLINVDENFFYGLNPQLSHKFDYAFSGCTSLTTAPRLWEIYPNSSGTKCYEGCTSLEWYDEIPEEWK